MKKRKIGDEVWTYDTLHQIVTSGKISREIIEDRGWLWGYEINYNNYRTIYQCRENIFDNESSARAKFKKYLKDNIKQHRFQIKYLQEILKKEPK
jgi:hypothetical protein